MAWLGLLFGIAALIAVVQAVWVALAWASQPLSGGQRLAPPALRALALVWLGGWAVLAGSLGGSCLGLAAAFGPPTPRPACFEGFGLGLARRLGRFGGSLGGSCLGLAAAFGRPTPRAACFEGIGLGRIAGHWALMWPGWRRETLAARASDGLVGIAVRDRRFDCCCAGSLGGSCLGLAAAFGRPTPRAACFEGLGLGLARRLGRFGGLEVPMLLFALGRGRSGSSITVGGGLVAVGLWRWADAAAA